MTLAHLFDHKRSDINSWYFCYLYRSSFYLMNSIQALRSIVNQSTWPYDRILQSRLSQVIFLNDFVFQWIGQHYSYKPRNIILAFVNTHRRAQNNSWPETRNHYTSQYIFSSFRACIIIWKKSTISGPKA